MNPEIKFLKKHIIKGPGIELNLSNTVDLKRFFEKNINTIPTIEIMNARCTMKFFPCVFISFTLCDTTDIIGIKKQIIMNLSLLRPKYEAISIPKRYRINPHKLKNMSHLRVKLLNK